MVDLGDTVPGELSPSRSHAAGFKVAYACCPTDGVGPLGRGKAGAA